jgi:hypothetical protein
MAAQQLRFAVIRTFYGLLLAQARLEVSDEAVKTAEADVKRARDIFESGLAVSQIYSLQKCSCQSFANSRFRRRAI